MAEPSNLPVPKSIEYTDMYFSGTQAKVFFGNVWVDDIVTINWDLVEQKAPLYGYASEVYDGVAKGTQIVQGVFTIAFKQNEYISTVIDVLNTRGSSGKDILKRVQDSKMRRSFEARKQSRANLPAAVTKVFNYEQLLDKIQNEQTGAFKHFSGFLEDNIWGALENQHLSAEQATDKDKLNGTVVDGFDILVTYGHIGNHPSEWTLKGIGDVHITGIRQIVNPTGEPVLEAYTFFGRRLDPYKERDQRAKGILAAENIVNPFGSDWFGSQGQIEAEQAGYGQSNKEAIGVIDDTDGNPINDDPADGAGESEVIIEQPNAIIPTVKIIRPVGGTYFSMVGGTFPIIQAEVELVGVPPGEALNIKFDWALTYTPIYPFQFKTSLVRTTTGPRWAMDVNQLAENGGNLVLIVSASYYGVDIQSSELHFGIIG